MRGRSRLGIAWRNTRDGRSRREKIGGCKQVWAVEQASSGVEFHWIVKISVVERIDEVQSVGDVPGHAKVGGRCYALASGRSVGNLIPGSGTRLASIPILDPVTNNYAAARVARLSGEIQPREVVGL